MAKHQIPFWKIKVQGGLFCGSCYFLPLDRFPRCPDLWVVKRRRPDGFESDWVYKMTDEIEPSGGRIYTFEREILPPTEFPVPA